MVYGILGIVLIIAVLEYMEISKLKSQTKRQQEQIDRICKAIQKEQLSENYVSDELKQNLIELKSSGKEVEAVRTLRKATHMSLLEAKEYIDRI